MNAGDEQKPGEKFPARKCEADAGPGVSSGVDVAGGINSLHEAHGFFFIDLRKAHRNDVVVKIEKLDAGMRVHPADARNAGAAKSAGTIVENCKAGHRTPGANPDRSAASGKRQRRVRCGI